MTNETLSPTLVAMLDQLAADGPQIVSEYGPDHASDAFAWRADEIVERCQAPLEHDLVFARIDYIFAANGLIPPPHEA